MTVTLDPQLQKLQRCIDQLEMLKARGRYTTKDIGRIQNDLSTVDAQYRVHLHHVGGENREAGPHPREAVDCK